MSLLVIEQYPTSPEGSCSRCGKPFTAASVRVFAWGDARLLERTQTCEDDHPTIQLTKTA